MVMNSEVGFFDFEILDRGVIWSGQGLILGESA